MLTRSRAEPRAPTPHLDFHYDLEVGINDNRKNYMAASLKYQSSPRPSTQAPGERDASLSPGANLVPRVSFWGGPWERGWPGALGLGAWVEGRGDDRYFRLHGHLNSDYHNPLTGVLRHHNALLGYLDLKRDVRAGLDDAMSGLDLETRSQAWT